ncbi:DUF397 domain-containing protein [Streptomyces sp. NPDC051567]|uniref:DUF397 domain-containing protein n=1 Tax=Streptomyces sp. NPDC051567 TaxID=3365660 RepID=UPI0037B27D9D
MTVISNSSASGLIWTKSSYSEGATNCLEVAHGVCGAVPVRDSKVPAGPALVFGDSHWGVFLNAVKGGRL